MYSAVAKRLADFEMRKDYQFLMQSINSVGDSLTRRQLESIVVLVHKIHRRKYKQKRKTPLYGTMSKEISDEELRRLFAALHDDRYIMMFELQAMLGLRLGEVIKVKLSDISFETRELTVLTEKARVVNQLIIPSELFERLWNYADRHRAQIEAASGFLFFKDNRYSHPHGDAPKHLDQNYVRKTFREARVKAGLDQVYAMSDETKGRAVRALHRITTHSLRHHAITKFNRVAGGDMTLTQMFARHLDPKQTLTYIHRGKDELYRHMDNLPTITRQKHLLEVKPA